MRRRLSATICKAALGLSLLMAATGLCAAQEYSNTPVTVSKEKVKVGGKLCYSHIVLEKQTLYSISKAYNVSIDDIYRFNPALKETGLKKNSIILIPSQEALQEENVKPKEETVKAKDAEVKVRETPVKAKETPVKVKETPVKAKETPATLDSLKRSTPAEQAKGQRIHIRKWYEDIVMIADMYDVSVEAIMTANNLTSKKLNRRHRLIIPAKETRPATDSRPSEIPDSETEGVAQTEAVSPSDTTGEDGGTTHEWYLFPKSEVKATVLLPMRNVEGKLSRNNMDFYSGMMLAVYDLAQEGVNTDITTYDITDISTPVTKEDIEDSDLIIGPITTADLTRLFQSSPKAGTVISPLDPRAERLVATNRNMVQVPTPHRAQYQDLVDWIKEDMQENDKVFMFSERVARNNDAITSMKEVMDQSGLEYTPFAYSILEGRDIIEPLKGMMSAEGTNRIYIASESEAFVNDVVRNLNLMLLEEFDVVLYAPSKIRSFDTIEVEHFHNTSMHVSLTYFINYEDQAVKDFLLKYRALYNTEPTQFAFQGYDIARYFISLCHKYGKRWPEKLEENEKAMLQSTFRCMKHENGGWVNNGVRRVIYGEKWSVRQIR